MRDKFIAPSPDSTAPEIPHGYCQCGCGQQTKIAERSDLRRNQIKGQPLRFVHGHNVLIQRPANIGNCIPLTKGMVAYVDPADVALVAPYRWHARSCDHGKRWYATAIINGHPVHMHCFIMRATDGELVDHIDGDSLNNRRENLRIATHSQNAMNMRPRAVGKTSRYKGVSLDRRSGRWIAQIGYRHKSIRLGSFTDECLAARAYDRAARELFGEFALTNAQLGLLKVS